MNKNTNTTPSQDAAHTSLFDELMAQLSEVGSRFSSSQLTDAISKLQAAKNRAQKRENQERKTRSKPSEPQKKSQPDNDAHIQAVTCMDLPLDWENLFASDDRAEGVHADSISDGLILSLSNLGRVDIEYISTVTGADLKTVISTLKTKS